MSTASTATPATAEAVTPTVRQAARRWWLLGLVALGALAIVGITVLLLGGVDSGEPFAPDNAAPNGGRAVAEVLRQQGVEVQPVDRLEEAADLASGATLLVDDSGYLLDADQWGELLRASDRLVVVTPSFAAMSTVLPEARYGGYPASEDDVQAGCDLPAAERGGTMSLDDASGSLRVEGGDADVCFARDGAGQVVEDETGGTRVTLLASTQPFENEHVDEAGNAAVVLSVLGERERLVWLRPSLLDVADTADPTLATLTPTWVTPLVVLLGLTALAAAFWRGRRLGPLVVERLPVTVRSRETVEGRARLYQRSGARLRAADSLRIGAVGRIAPLLGLSRSTPVDEVARAAAARTRTAPEVVRAVLLDAEPASDAQLVALSDDLARLERAVRQTAPHDEPAARAGGPGAPATASASGATAATAPPPASAPDRGAST